MSSPLICHFEPLDTWFFREARPHGSMGNSELGSQFPPPVRTRWARCAPPLAMPGLPAMAATGAAWAATPRCRPSSAWATTWARCAPVAASCAWTASAYTLHRRT